MPPWQPNFAGPSVNLRAIDTYLRSQAKGGAGLIIVENVQVKYPKRTSHSSSDWTRTIIPAIELAKRCMHTRHGFSSRSTTAAGQYYNDIGRRGGCRPSVHTVRVSSEPVRALRSAEIPGPDRAFFRNSARQKAWMDGSSFMALTISHQLSSCLQTPISAWNEWAVHSRRRMRFPLKIIERTRERSGPMSLLSFRFSARVVEGADHLEDSKKIARMLENPDRFLARERRHL